MLSVRPVGDFEPVAYDIENKYYVFYNKNNKEEKKPYEQKELAELYYGKKQIPSLKRSMNTELPPNSAFFEDNTASFIPFYNHPSGRTIHYVIGKSGLGKTTMTTNIIKNVIKKSKSNIGVYLISPLDEGVNDPSFEGLKIRSVEAHKLVSNDKNDYETQLKEYNEMKINFKYKKKEIEDEELLREMELKLLEYKPTKIKGNYSYTPLMKKILESHDFTYFIFEDADSLDKNIYVAELLKNILIHGRHDRINAFIIAHTVLPQSSVLGKYTWKESHIISFFGELPHASSAYLMREYSFDRYQIKKIRDLLKNSRHVSIIDKLNIWITEKNIIKY